MTRGTRVRKIFATANEAVGFLANLHFASAFVGDVKGLMNGESLNSRKDGAQEDFTAKMQRLPEEDSRILLHFFEWLFQRGKAHGLSGRFTAWWYANAFRAYVSKMPVSGDGDKAVAFLQKIAQIIAEEPDKEEGYRAVLRYFSVMGVPHAPDSSLPRDIAASFGLGDATLSDSANNLLSWIDQKYEEMESRNNAPGLRAALRRWYRSLR